MSGATDRPQDHDPAEERVSEATRHAEEDEERLEAGADRPPTEQEEAAAERTSKLDPGVAETHRDQNKRGANAKGEGRIG